MGELGLVAAVLAGFALALLAPWLARFRQPGAGWVLALLPAALAGYFLLHAAAVVGGTTRAAAVPWIPALDVRLSFYLDGLSLLFALLITGIGALIVVYTGGYLAGHPQLGRFYAYLLLFMAAMLGLVLADNAVTMFVFWELTSLSSYLLIGFDHERPQARAAALQSLLVTSSGGLALLAGLVLLGQVAGTAEISGWVARADAIRAHPAYVPALLLVLAGAFTKSAQVPFHFWLPNAMVAPTPVSAYLHSATMVKAGVYLLARLHPALGETPVWQAVVIPVGAVTMVVGAYLALQDTDAKRILAYSTVGALGLLTMLLGEGSREAAAAAAAFLLAHALYKGSLFLVAGAVDHETGVRDVERLGGLRVAMPVTALAGGVAAASMAGIPPLAGFLGKEMAYEAVLHAGILLAATVAAATLFVAAGVLVGMRPFLGDRVVTGPLHEPPLSLLLGPVVLAAMGLAAGVLPGLLMNPLVEAAASSILGRPAGVSVALWHGWNPTLALSVLTLAAGAGAYGMRHRLRGWHARVATWPGPARWYEYALDLVNLLARWQTALLQSGYLRYYLLIIVGTAAALGWYTLVLRAPLRLPAAGDARFHEVVIAVVIVTAALAAARSRSRLGAAAALGVSGYGVALIFLLFGAPDLAITQFLVETLTVVLFVLVFYHLPRFALLSPRAARIRDALVATAAGGLMTALLLASRSLRGPSDLAQFFATQSLPAAHGRNIVNVILVDFRGLDTLGEITVLAAAGVGVFVLLRLRLDRRNGG